MVKVLVNANPFQAGRLILGFAPFYENLGAAKLNRGQNITMATTGPHVELNIRDSSAEMYIPFVAPTPFVDITVPAGQTYDWGSIYVMAMTPLLVGSAGQSDIDVEVYLSFTDVILAAPVVPESASQPKFHTNEKAARTTAYSTRKREMQALSWSKPSMAVNSIIDISDSIGSSVLSKIPGVATVSSAVSGGLNALSRGLESLGWAKPLNSDPSITVMQRMADKSHNADSNMQCDNLALSSVAQLPDGSSHFGADVDEMSLSFLKSIHPVIKTVDWNTTQVSETVLVDQTLNLLNCLKTESFLYSGHISRTVIGNPVFLMALNCGLWRGSIKMTLKFVKTDFHNGRLLVAFTPSTSSPSFNSTNYLIREIVDLKETNEISLVLPYMQNQDFLRNGNPGDYASLGHLKIFVLNQLRCPETVSDTTKILMYISPGDDFEIAAPSTLNVHPFIPESALGESRKLTSKILGNGSVTADGLFENSICVSDPILTIKQLLLKKTRVYSDSALFYASSHARFTPAASVFVARTPSDTELQVAQNGLFGDWVAFLAPMFALERGSYVCSVMDNTRQQSGIATLTPMSTTQKGLHADDTYPPGINTLDFYKLKNSQIAVRSQTAGLMDAMLPHWGATPTRHVQVLGLSDFYNIELPGASTHSLDLYTPSEQFGLGSIYRVFRSVGDDFAFGYFAGVPRMFLGSVPV